MFKAMTVLLVSSLFSINAFAAFVGPGTTVETVTSVKGALDMADDTKLVLEGTLVKQVHSEHYLFKDNSGEVVVEIEDKDFRKITVTPENKIRLKGEVDKDWTDVKIDVDFLELVK